MPRHIWSGAISFGLVTVPIKLEPATESHSISFNQIHLEDGGRIRYRKVCEIDGKELRQDEISKGYEISKDTVIPITDEDLANMPLPTAKAIEIAAFIPWESVDQRHIGESSYYLSADGPVAAKPYTLLRQALGRTEKVAVAKFALRGRERLGLLRPYGDVLLLHAMRWDDEVRDPAELAPDDVDLTEKEIREALALMDAMSVEHLADIGEDELTDHYREALVDVIEGKVDHREPKATEGEEAAPAGKVVDLMAALEESVLKAKEARGETGEHATVHEMPKPKKKAATKKAPAKKTAAKRTTAKKTTRRKSA